MRSSLILTLGALFLVSSPMLAGDNALPQMRLLGCWSNVDNQTGGLMQVVISNRDGSWMIETWGKAGGQPHSNGKATLHLLGSNISARALDHGFATWDFGFKVEHATVYRDGDQLIVESYNIFKDNSGRSNYRTRYVFRRTN